MLFLCFVIYIQQILIIHIYSVNSAITVYPILLFTALAPSFPQHTQSHPLHTDAQYKEMSKSAV